MAQRMARLFDVPAIAVSFNDDVCTGSLRSARGFNVCALLEQCADLFIDSGGHHFAAGFSIEKTKWDSFLERLGTVVRSIELKEGEDEETISVDAELPPGYLDPEKIFKDVVDRFEPYGKENEPLTFLARKLKVREISFIGKPESKHVKMLLDTGKHKWPALYWQAADRVLNHEFNIDDTVDLVFNLSKDWFKGMETPQIMVTDLKKSEIQQ
jgi:single-stranded-DNA-specific exonuclease